MTIMLRQEPQIVSQKDAQLIEKKKNKNRRLPGSNPFKRIPNPRIAV
jgi:hypothetical protein